MPDAPSTEGVSWAGTALIESRPEPRRCTPTQLGLEFQDPPNLSTHPGAMGKFKRAAELASRGSTRDATFTTTSSHPMDNDTQHEAEYETQPAIEITQQTRSFLLTKLTAKTLVTISYASVRGRDDEEGAIQRYLNPRRISNLRDYALSGGDYPSSIVLNWVNEEEPITLQSDLAHIAICRHSAQIIDGQHRVAGLEEALKSKEELGAVEIPVAIYSALNTTECADIFLSINTEQKPVPKSLVFDLYDVSSDYMVDPAAVRARDIATAMNDHTESAYRGLIKFPGSQKTRGGLALSTVVTALKPLIEDKGVFDQVGISEFESQSKSVLNYFSALQHLYGESWQDPQNAFLYAAGFLGAIDFFRARLITFCCQKKSFTTKTMTDAMRNLADAPIQQSEIKGLGGKSARSKVHDLLTQRLSLDSANDRMEF